MSLAYGITFADSPIVRTRFDTLDCTDIVRKEFVPRGTSRERILAGNTMTKITETGLTEAKMTT